MSSTTQPTSTPTPAPSTGPVFGAPPTGGNTTLYLFTFLITIVVLGLITALLLLRAYYVRRAFHRRIEEAIRSGRPLPPEAFPGLRTNRRGKKEKQHGPMPSMWEAEMWRNGHEWMTEKDAQKDWQSLTPLCMTREAPSLPPLPPLDPEMFMPQRRGPWFLRPFLKPRMPDLSQYAARHPDPNRPDLVRAITGQTLPRVEPVWTIPEDDEEVVLGVVIAMPVEGKALDRWDLEQDPEEAEVPEVYLGVMSCQVQRS